jgi:small ligand-binding sensory domain FIST
MPFFAALSTNPDTARAIKEICKGAAAAFQGPADLGLIFFSPDHAKYLTSQAGALQKRLATKCLLGCAGESIIGNEQEIEQQPAVSLWLGRWPQSVTITPFHIPPEPAAEAGRFESLIDRMALTDSRNSAVLLLADPFSSRATVFLDQVNERMPGLRVMGGMAGGGRGSGRCNLLLDSTMYERGAVGVLLSGTPGVACILSRGCRPIGKPFVIRRAQQNVITELDGKPPVLLLQQLYRDLGPHDRQAFQQSLHIGWPVNEAGDLLIRTPIGLDRASGALTINDRVAAGQRVQFLVRDAASADEELQRLLQTELRASDQKPGGALLFTCNRRGSRLFSQPHHDAGVIRSKAGTIPVAGFFAEGEIGPVGGRNFVHGHTATVVLLWD